MKIIHAHNAALSLPMLRAATLGYDNLETCKLHPAMLCAFEMLAMDVATVVEKKLDDDLSGLLKRSMNTVAGVPVELSLDAPMNMIEFIDGSGNVITKIENLAIPVYF